MATTFKYEKPQVKVFQNFTEVPTATVGNQPVFVFGPNFQLYRYDEESEHDSTRVPATSMPTWTGSSEITIPYPVTGTVDTSWVRLFAEGVAAEVGAATVKSVAADSVNIGLYTVDANATYVLVKATGSGEIALVVGDSIYDSDPATYAQIVALYANEDSATSTTYPQVAKLSSQILDNLSSDTAVSIFNVLTSAEIPAEWDGAANWTATAAGVKITPSTAKIESARTDDGATILSATAWFIQFRTKRVDNAGGIASIDSTTGISVVGQVDPANPLAYGVYMAKLNSGSCPVYFMATTGTNLAAFKYVLNKATLTGDVYALVPMSDDPEVLNAVKSHIKDMRAPEVKKWRIGWVAAGIEDSKTIYGGKLVSGDQATCKLQFVTSAGAVDPSVKALTTISPGDVIEVSASVSYTVDYVVDDQTVMVLESISSTLAKASILGVTHTYTGAQKAELIAAKSRSFGEEYIYNVFPSKIHQIINGEQVVVEGYFAAAAVAGLASSTLPQQPLTNMTITGITDVPETYEQFNSQELDVMAAGGTFIIAQDLPYDRVYVRHQLSTATYEGNLLTRELSIVKNVDSVSYYLSATCEDLIGKYNITPELLRVVELRLQTAIDWLCNNTEGGLYGPQLLEDGTEILAVQEHPTLEDHAQAYIRLNPPKPFNNLEIYLTVI